MKRIKPLFPIVVIVTVIFLVFLPYLLGNVGVTPFVGTNDYLDLQVPFRAILQQNIKAGSLPLWEPRISAGFPLFAEGQIAALHPLSILFALLPVQAYYSVSLNIITTLCISTVGMYLYLNNLFKKNQDKKLLALFGSLVWGLSGFQLNHVAHLNNINVLSMLPWQILIIDRIFDCQGNINKAEIALLYPITLALQILSGHPQFTAYALLYNGAYIVLKFFLTRFNFKTIIVTSLLISASITLGIGMGAIQLVPTLEFSQNSTRQSGLTEDTANFLSFRLQDLRTFVTPFYDYTSEPRSIARLAQIGWPFDERYSYIGILPIILTVISLFFVVKNKTVLAHALLGVFFLLLSMGNQTPLGSLLRVPPLNMFRLPTKFTVFFQFAAAIAAAYTVFILISLCTKKIKSVDLRGKIVFGVMLLFIIGTIADTAPKLYTIYPIQKGDWWYSKPTTINLYEKVAKNREGDKYYNERVIGQDYNIQLQKQYLEQDPRLWNESQMVVFKNNREILPAFNMLLYDVPLLTNAINSAGLKVKWYSDIENILFWAPNKEKKGNSVSYDSRYWNLTRLSGAKYFIHDQTLSDANVETIGLTNFTTGQDQIGLYKINNTLDFIQIPQHIVYVNKEQSFNVINSLDFNPATSIVLPSEAPKIIEPTIQPTRIQIQFLSQTHYKIALTTSQNTPVFLRQAFYPGWRAYDNKKETPIYRASHAFMAIVVPPGDHEINIEYRPTSFKIGAIISFLTTCIYLTIIFGLTIKKYRTSGRVNSQIEIQNPPNRSTEARL